MGGLAGRFPGTKFVVPRVPVGLVARPELVAGLARDVMAVPLTLLSAPAGYGKTVLGVWLASDLTGARVCWVSVDADDNDPRRLLTAMTAALRGGVPETGQRLTAREAQILVLLAAGMTNPEIAERLTIGEETVKTHVARVLRKLGVRSRAAAAGRAHQFGITAQSPPATSA